MAVLALAATLSLGRWQLDRAAYKEALQAEIDAQKQRPPLDQTEFLSMEKPAEAVNRTVQLRGLWLAPQTVYLDNRQMHGVPGFYVLTPLALEGSEVTVMVQRGWLQRNFNDRTQLAPIDTPAGLVEVTGRIAPPPSQLLQIGRAVSPASAPAAPAGTAAPATSTGSADAGVAAALPPDGLVGSSPIRQNLDLTAFRTETALPLRTDVSIQQTGAASEGLKRDWPAPALGVEKHYGYAFQWFGLAALVIVLYVWFQLIAPFRRARRERRSREF